MYKEDNRNSFFCWRKPCGSPDKALRHKGHKGPVKVVALFPSHKTTQDNPKKVLRKPDKALKESCKVVPQNGQRKPWERPEKSSLCKPFQSVPWPEKPGQSTKKVLRKPRGSPEKALECPGRESQAKAFKVAASPDKAPPMASLLWPLLIKRSFRHTAAAAVSYV